jgi:hypothetical protein
MIHYSIFEVLETAGKTAEKARLAGRSLTADERTLIDQARQLGHLQGLSAQMMNTIEMEGAKELQVSK